MIKIKYIFYKLLMFFLTLTIINSCIIVKEQDEYITKKSDKIVVASPKSEVKMSDVVIRTPAGDMLALIPQDWFFIETNEKISSDIFAVAVNPDYTLAAVFSTLKKTENNENIINKEGLLGLARLCFAKHNEKAVGEISLTEKYELINIGNQKFANFSFVRVKDNGFVKSAVFISDIGNFYEFSLVTLNVTNNIIVCRNEFDKYYRSILFTLKY